MKLIPLSKDPPLDPPEDHFGDWCERFDLDPEDEETINAWREITTAPPEQEYQ